MALGLPERGGGEDRTPIVKYDARAGRLFRVDRTQADGSWESNTVEITPVFQAVFDLEHIELGWLYFPTNGAPEIVVAPYGEPLPAKPSTNHRPGFRVHMLLGKQAGGDIREMAANAQASIRGMDKLHDDYLSGVKTHDGQLPVVRLGKTVAIASSGKDANGKAMSSTNYQPEWEIVKWVPRPPELVMGGAAANQQQDPQQGVTQAKTTQQEAPAPEPVQPPSVEDDF